mgnify:FL=1
MSGVLLNKKIVLGVTGSIAAYKAADLVRRLQDAGAEVRVVMTQSACEFITPLTMQTLSGSPVAIDLLDTVQESTMGHITLARWAGWVLIAPASANTIANLAYGQTDDLLSALCLATESPVAIAPAMNNKMWQNQVTQSNLAQLSARGIYIIGPDSGDQACGEQGEGRLLEPNDIVDELSRIAVPARLQGKHVVVTAGPTFEPIDPVRFMGNRSSGKMGFAIAKAAAEAGAKVTLISGPVALMTPPSVTRVDVETAEQMHDASMRHTSDSNIFIACAAVSDYRPETYQDSKLKKTQSSQLQLKLTINKDIVAAVAAKKNRPFVVGFAAETDNVEQYAKDKLIAKKLDMIAANKVGDGLGFGVDDNALSVFWQAGSKLLPKAPKSHLARDLMTIIIEQYYAKNTTEST